MLIIGFSYKCLFCFNKFTTKLDMIKHMNEYGHNRIDPENNFFDQFYIVNYMELKQVFIMHLIFNELKLNNFEFFTFILIQCNVRDVNFFIYISNES